MDTDRESTVVVPTQTHTHVWALHRYTATHIAPQFHMHRQKKTVHKCRPSGPAYHHPVWQPGGTEVSASVIAVGVGAQNLVQSNC